MYLSIQNWDTDCRHCRETVLAGERAVIARREGGWNVYHVGCSAHYAGGLYSGELKATRSYHWRNPWAARWYKTIGGSVDRWDRPAVQAEAVEHELHATETCTVVGCGKPSFTRPAVGGRWCEDGHMFGDLVADPDARSAEEVTASSEACLDDFYSRHRMAR